MKKKMLSLQKTEWEMLKFSEKVKISDVIDASYMDDIHMVQEKKV